MAVTAILHMTNEDPVLAELDEMPDPTSTYVLVRNPRRRDGKPLTMIADGVDVILYPWSRLTYIEILGDSEGGAGRESIVGFFRDTERSRNLP